MADNKLMIQIAKELNLKTEQVLRTIDLLDQGNTIPFIARYRKEITMSLDEDIIRLIEERIKYLRTLEQKKQDTIRLIAQRGQLSPELEQAILQGKTLQEIEDIYRPYKPKRQTRAQKAIQKGLEPLADKILAQQENIILATELEKYLAHQDLNTVDEVLEGALDIIAEWVTDEAKLRQFARAIALKKGLIQSDGQSKADTPFNMYYQYKERINKIPPHRILAMKRGEKEDILKISYIFPDQEIINAFEQQYIKAGTFNNAALIQKAINDGYRRLLKPALIREISNHLEEYAQDHSIKVFAQNLQKLLLQPPLFNATVMGIDPGFRTGCKVAVVDERGHLLDTETIYPHQPQKKWELSLRILQEMIAEYAVNFIAIGNGTAARETEELVVNLIKTAPSLKYIIVDEAGASVYSASPLAKQELPNLDVSMRGAVSIARRLIDPLAELVKIDPQSLGVGLYQHDVNPKKLKEKLEQVVEYCVNHVGVDLNTASPALLEYVAGLNKKNAKAIIEKRNEIKGFVQREQLKEIKGLGDKTFEQAAGFLRIYNEADPFACTPIHPESYQKATALLKHLNFQPLDLLNKAKAVEIKESLAQIDLDSLLTPLEIGKPTLLDIIDAFKKPGRDPREDLPLPIFRSNILSIEDLKSGIILKGTVRNVVDFGAFVDIGVKEDGLIHVSEMSSQYVKDPLKIVSVGDVVDVLVKDVDLARKRIALSLKLPPQ